MDPLLLGVYSLMILPILPPAAHFSGKQTLFDPPYFKAGATLPLMKGADGGAGCRCRCAEAISVLPAVGIPDRWA